jgi:hypothetical protein
MAWQGYAYTTMHGTLQTDTVLVDQRLETWPRITAKAFNLPSILPQFYNMLKNGRKQPFFMISG